LEYRIPIGQFDLRLGERIDVNSIVGRHKARGKLQQGWELPPGIYSAREIVNEVSTLLEAICIRIGSEEVAGALLDNVRASLATSGREATLPLDVLAQDDRVKNELLGQAQTIGAALVSWAHEALAARSGEQCYGTAALADLELRSRCEKHLWTPGAVSIMMGPSGSPEVMQMFNEYLHHMVLLRDALLPFVNWEQVPIEIGPEASGLRFIEPARERFITQLVMKGIPNKEIVAFAQSVLGVGTKEIGYGFQYHLGTVLPAMIGGSLPTASNSLLRWHSAALVSPTIKDAVTGQEQQNFIFVYANEDYEAAPRSFIGTGTNASAVEYSFSEEAEIIPAFIGGDHIVLTLQLLSGSTAYAIDVGQITRGYRYMYRPDSGTEDIEGNGGPDHSTWIQHSAADLLKLQGLAAFGDGVHYTSAGGNPLVLLALLGKLHPQNIVFLESGWTGSNNEVARALRAGKQFGAKVLLSAGGD